MDASFSAAVLGAHEVRFHTLDDGEWQQVADALELAPQQTRIVRLLVEGKGDKQIAAAMGVGLPTVRTYLTRAFQRTGVGDRVALVVRVYERARELRKRAEEQRP
jgi:DNA-binding NarL/FixJ family response regulator